MKKKTIYYWSPYLTEIATTKAVINSAQAVNKYSKFYEASIIDVAGEFQKKKLDLIDKKINLIKLTFFNYISFLPRYGKIKSRFSYMVIFFLSFFSLKRLLKKDKPEFIIIHLITSLPLVLFYFFNFKTKCILRISGYPIMNKYRIFAWKILLKNIHIVTCPTIATYNHLLSLNIVPQSKLKILYDPIINVGEINKKIKEKLNLDNKNFDLAVGRLTRQKNFDFLINCYNELVEEFPNIQLIIIGNGEEKKNLQKKINKFNLENNIKLLPFVENIFPFFKNANCFLLSSLWEDPGFVLVESSFTRTFVITSDCKNGPDEIIKKNNAGFVYHMNNQDDFIKKYKKFRNSSETDLKSFKKRALIKSKEFSIFNHSVKLISIVKDITTDI